MDVQFVSNIIEEKLDKKKNTQNGEERDSEDLLSRLVSSDLTPDEVWDFACPNCIVTPLQIKSNVFIFFAAGHETTATALAWAMYWLSLIPEVQTRARQEVDDVLHGELPTEETLPKVLL